MIEWLNHNQGFATTLLTLVYVVATIVIALIMMHANRLSSRNIDTMRHLEQQRNRPYVLFDLLSLHFHIHAKLANLGATPAYNVRVTITPSLKAVVGTSGIPNPSEREVPAGILDHPIALLAPKREITSALAYFKSFEERFPEMRFTGSVQYCDSDGRKYDEPFTIDLKYYENLLTISEKDPGEELEKIGKTLEQIERDLTNRCS